VGIKQSVVGSLWALNALSCSLVDWPIRRLTGGRAFSGTRTVRSSTQVRAVRFVTGLSPVGLLCALRAWMVGWMGGWSMLVRMAIECVGACAWARPSCCSPQGRTPLLFLFHTFPVLGIPSSFSWAPPLARPVRALMLAWRKRSLAVV